MEVEEARVVEHEAALGARGGAGAGGGACAGAGGGAGAGAGAGYGSSALLRATGYGTSVGGGGGDGGRGLLVGDILVVEGGLLAAAGACPWMGWSMFMPQFANT